MSGKPIELLYSDPAWFYNSRSAGAETKKLRKDRADADKVYNNTRFAGGAEKAYKCPQWRVDKRLREGWPVEKADYGLLTNGELLEIAESISRTVADNAVSITWCTCPTFATGFALEYIRACGFKPKTVAFTWFKMVDGEDDFKYGPGYYTASNLEFAILGVRGKGLGAPEKKMQPSIVCFEDEDHPQHIILGKRGAHSIKPLIHSAIDAMYPDRVKCELFAREAYGGWPSYGCEITGNDMLIDLENIRNV